MHIYKLWFIYSRPSQMKRPPQHRGHLDCFNHFPEPLQLQNGQLPHSNQDLWQISLCTGEGKRLAKKPPRKNLKRSKDLRLRQTKHLLVLHQVSTYIFLNIFLFCFLFIEDFKNDILTYIAFWKHWYTEHFVHDIPTVWQFCAAMMSWVRRWVELVVYYKFLSSVQM